MRSTKLSTIAADLSEFADGIEANIPKLINKAAAKAVELATETVLGSPSDESTANTVYGQSKAAKEAAERATAAAAAAASAAEDASTALEGLNDKIELLYGKTGSFVISVNQWTGSDTPYKSEITIIGVGDNDVIFLYPTTSEDCQAVDYYGVFA